MTELTTDFSVSPYFDDYDEDKKFYRILFRPRTAVQARELTQLQTILQKQISRFGSHVFKNGTIVDGCAISYIPRLRYVHLENNFNDSELVSVTEISNSYIITNSLDSNTAVRAVPVLAKDGFVSNYPDTNRIYLKYISAGRDSGDDVQHRFEDSETLYIFDSNQNKFGQLDANNVIDSIDMISGNNTANASGIAYAVTVSDGLIYQKGHFLKLETQTITVRDFDREVDNYVVGFNTNERIVNSSQDVSLKDQSAGFSNLNAPGADRLELTPVLVAFNKNDVDNDGFFPIIEFDGATPSQQASDPVYNKLGDEFARRTYEKAGNFYIKPFQVETVENSANNERFVYELSTGVSYIKGHRVEFTGPNRIDANRAIATNESQNQIITSNYGSYVVADEFVGALDISNIGQVDLYDTAQKSLSDYEGISGGTAGILVGKANVKMVSYKTGVKGTPGCRYFVYIFNIQMNSGKSFSSDAKSFVSTSARGDFVLESGTVRLRDTSRQSLIFDTGHTAVKRLTDKNGVNDTSYIYRQTSTATLQSNGFVTFTINTPAPGSIESLGFSVGQVSAINRNRFDIAFTANAFSSNSSGTLNVVSGNTIVIGSNTSFVDDFSANDLIRINIGGSSFEIRRIESIINATAIELDSSISTSNNSANYQRYFVGGTLIDLSGANAGINVISNTQFQVSTDLTLDSGSQTVTGQYPVLRNLAIPSSKNIRKNRLVKIDLSTNSAGTQGPWNLGFTDVSRINTVHIGNTYANTNPNRIDWFILDSGQKDDFYEHARLFVKPEFANRLNTSSRLLISLDHFVANTSAGVGFFSVESYPVDDANTANTIAIQTAQIPFHEDEQGTRYDLRNSLDFRPRKFDTAASIANTDPANTSITTNPATSNNSFNVTTGGQYLIEADTNFRADIEYYLPRIDLIVVDKSGAISTKQGVAEESPKTPSHETDVSLIARAIVPPYPSLTQRESERFNRKDIAIKIEPMGNRRYTMRDIGRLEKRIKRLEYYTVLNALEQKARDLTIPDENGLDRFKNGIFADPFNSHNIGKVTDFEYNISIDKDNNIARPKVKVRALDFKYSSSLSSGVARRGAYVTRPFVGELFINQPYATKFRNATELEWQWNGNLRLYPEQDFYRDEQFGPNLNIELDLATPWEQFANSPFGATYGDWRNVSSQSTSSSRTSATSGGTQTATTTTTTTTQQRIVEELNIDNLTNEYDFGSYVTDFSIQPYMRSRTVAFVATNMKPNSRVYAFFDREPVSIHCAPGTLSGIAGTIEGAEDRHVHRTAEYGEPLFTNESGFVAGIFRIPENSFRVGDRQFSLYGIDDLEVGNDAIMTRASSIYHASSVAVTRQNATLSTREPQILYTEDIQRRTQTNSVTNTTFIPFPPPAEPPKPIPPDDDDGYLPGPPPDEEDPETADPIIFEPPPPPGGGVPPPPGGGVPPPPVWTPPPPALCDVWITDGSDAGNAVLTQVPCFDGGGENGQDSCPLSQSFLVNVPTNSTGAFISNIGLFFRSKDPTFGCSVFLMEMRGGHPDITNVLGKAYLPSSSINAPGGNIQQETVFTFDNPIYIEKDRFYAFMIFPDAVSPEYTFWLSEIGEIDVETGEQVFRNVGSGNAFRSSNQYTWSAIQEEDIKFNLYRARFEVGIGSVHFTNEDDEYLVVDQIIRANTSLGISLGDVAYTVNATSNTTIVSNTAPYGVVQFIDEAEGIIELNDSRGGFVANTGIRFYRVADEWDESQITSGNLIASGVIENVLNIPTHAVVPRISKIVPASTSINYEFRAFDQFGVMDSVYTSVQSDTETEFLDKERFIYSRSNEASGPKSAEYRITISTTDTYVSPVIDLGRKGSLHIENKINNDSTNEHTRYGSALAKYISKNVILADGQEAEDLKIYLTAYRPVDTNIEVYVKFQNPEDPEPFESKLWTKMEYIAGESLFSNPADVRDYREFEFGVPAVAAFTNSAFLNPLTGVVEYENSDGSVFTTFKKYSIKIVLLSNNKVRVPRLNDVRGIALQA
jgi:hypothetical protein